MIQGGWRVFFFFCFLKSLSPITYLSQVFEGAPSETFYAVDIDSHWDIGYTMFRAKFIETDIPHPFLSLTALKSSVDIIWDSKVLHQ
jgi:hypothetical protein